MTSPDYVLDSYYDAVVNGLTMPADVYRGEPPVRPEDTPDALALYARVAETPDDPFPRLVFADWLEGRAGTESCPQCGGNGDLYTADTIDESVGEVTAHCDGCSGTGRVPDRTARLAEGYRALGEYGLTCCDSYGESRYVPNDDATWFIRGQYRNPPSAWERRYHLPRPWFDRLTGGEEVVHDGYRRYRNMREGDDAAALAWCAMTDEDRERCRAGLTGEVRT